MKVHGVLITEEQLSAGRAAMGERFQTTDVVGALTKAGVPWFSDTRHIWQPCAMPAYEAANRLLQKERKAGRIAHTGGGKWRAIASMGSSG